MSSLKFSRHFPLILLLAPMSASSLAAEPDPLNFLAGQSVTFDGNLFRLPEGVEPSALETGVTAPGRSDTISKTSAGVNFDKPYSRQRLHADFTAAHFAYQTYSYLDINVISGRAAWDAALGARWKGTLGYERAQTPSTDASQTGFRTSYQLNQRVGGDVNYRLNPAWSVGIALAKVANNYNNSVSTFRGYDARLADTHITYGPSSGNQIQVLFRRTDGDYSNQVPSLTGSLTQPYTQGDYEVDAKWVVGGHSRAFGRVGYSSIHSMRPLRAGDLDGPTGRLAYDWTPTGRTTVGLALRREIGPQLQYVDASFVTTSAASIVVSSVLSPRLSVRGFIESRADDLGVEAGAFDSRLRNPYYTQYTLTGAWMLHRSLLLNVTVGHETRKGSNPAFPPYDDNTVSANLQFLSR
jgi:hypothetical protein